MRQWRKSGITTRTLRVREPLELHHTRKMLEVMRHAPNAVLRDAQAVGAALDEAHGRAHRPLRTLSD